MDGRSKACASCGASFSISALKPAHKFPYCPPCQSAKMTARNRAIRAEVLGYYSGGPPRCACCGTDTFDLLSIDHLNGGGEAHRKEVGGGTRLYRWLRKSGYPQEFQVLCFNCNLAKGFYGSCPHTRSRFAYGLDILAEVCV